MDLAIFEGANFLLFFENVSLSSPPKKRSAPLSRERGE